MSPADNYYPASTFANGNTTIVTAAAKYAPNLSTIGMTSGKWYWETKAVARGGASEYLIGIASTQYTLVAQELGNMDNDWGYYSSAGNYRNNKTYLKNIIIEKTVIKTPIATNPFKTLYG